jgi:hypothetical protein
MESAQSDLAKLVRSLPKPQTLRDANEAKTRIVFIDRVLAVCDWAAESLRVEEPTGGGDYIDYLLADAQQQPWMVVEAKRVSRTFAMPKSSHPYRSLATLARQSSDLKEALEQAARYCNDRGVPYACVTNGYQWLFFRGLSSSGRPWLKSNALVFDSLDDVALRSTEFLRCLHRTYAFSPTLQELLERSTGAGLLAERRPTEQMPPMQRPIQNPLPATRAAANFFFSDIYDGERLGMLDECYVVPGHSSEFDITLQRLLKDSPDDLGDMPDDTRDGTPRQFINDLAADSRFCSVQHPIAVVGNVGAGKTTFLRKVLVDLIRTKSVITAYVNLEGHSTGGALSQDTESRHLTREIIKELTSRGEILVRGRKDISKAEIPQVHPDSRETLSTIFRERIESDRRLGERLWAVNPQAWEERKLAIYDEERRDEVRYLHAFIKHLKARIPPGEFREGVKKRIPVVVFVDNLDQGTDEYQRFVYGFCAELTTHTGAIAVLCLREDTYRAGRRAGGFLTSSQLHYVFHVASPPLDQVIKLRLEYGQKRLTEGRLPPVLATEKEPVESTLDVVNAVFGTPTSEATSLVAALSGQDVRESLRLVRAVVQGTTECGVLPRPSGECLFECMAARFGTRMGASRPGVFNLFDVPPWLLPLHALPARLIAYFVRAHDHVSKVALERTERVLTDFGSWGYPTSIVREVLLALLHGGMLRSPELTQVQAEAAEILPSRLIVTASGHAHVTRVVPLSWYRALAALHMRWYDEDSLKTFVKQCNDASGWRGVTIGDVVTSGAVSTFDAYLSTSLAKEDAQLATAFSSHEWVRSVRSRAYIFEHDGIQQRGFDEQTQRQAPPPPTRASENQMVLFAASVPQTTSIPMPSLSLEDEYMGSVWIPRILWALIHAERTKSGPLTAAEIDRTLAEHAGINVHGTNVARAFRDMKGTVDQLWVCQGKRYALTDAGRHAFHAAFREFDLSTSGLTTPAN